MNTKLVEDFLNEVKLKSIDEIILGNKAEVLSWHVKNNSCFIEVNFYLCGEYKDLEVSLFDLISFVYSKVAF
jgi:hypothetical protein